MTLQTFYQMTTRWQSSLLPCLFLMIRLDDGDAIRAKCQSYLSFPSVPKWLDYRSRLQHQPVVQINDSFSVSATQNSYWPFHLTSWLICVVQLFSHGEKDRSNLLFRLSLSKKNDAVHLSNRRLRAETKDYTKCFKKKKIAMERNRVNRVKVCRPGG